MSGGVRSCQEQFSHAIRINVRRRQGQRRAMDVRASIQRRPAPGQLTDDPSVVVTRCEDQRGLAQSVPRVDVRASGQERGHAVDMTPGGGHEKRGLALGVGREERMRRGRRAREHKR